MSVVPAPEDPGFRMYCVEQTLTVRAYVLATDQPDAEEVAAAHMHGSLPEAEDFTSTDPLDPAAGDWPEDDAAPYLSEGARRLALERGTHADDLDGAAWRAWLARPPVVTPEGPARVDFDTETMLMPWTDSPPPILSPVAGA